MIVFMGFPRDRDLWRRQSGWLVSVWRAKGSMGIKERVDGIWF